MFVEIPKDMKTAVDQYLDLILLEKEAGGRDTAKVLFLLPACFILFGKEAGRAATSKSPFSVACFWGRRR